MNLTPDIAFGVMEEQIGLIPNPPKVLRNQAWANKLEDLPVASLYMVSDDLSHSDLDGDGSWFHKEHLMTIRIALRVAKTKGESLSESIYKLATAISLRFDQQDEIMRGMAPNVVQFAEGDMDEIDIDNSLKTVTATANKHYIIRYWLSRSEGY